MVATLANRVYFYFHARYDAILYRPGALIVNAPFLNLRPPASLPCRFMS